MNRVRKVLGPLVVLLGANLWLSKGANSKDTVRYYVNSPVCKMPYVNPFTWDTMSDFHRKKMRECRNDSDLVTSQFDFNTHQYRLHIHEHLARPLLKTKGHATLECEYSNISRNTSAKYPDDYYIQSKMHRITNHEVVPNNTDYIITKCYVRSSNHTRKIVQSDSMSFIQDPLTNKKVRDFERKQRTDPHPSVLIMGLDSTSRINLRRAMPLVYEYVKRPGWFEMQGYNKVGDNTFPNLMAVLTGHSEAGVEDLCDVREKGCLDSLPFIWKRFKEANYTTAFAEDCKSISTFNYLKPGFVKKPTDYYLRPLLLASEEQFPVSKDWGYAYCVGRHLSFRYVWDFGQQLVDRFLGRSPFFGFLWSNSFTHDFYEGATALDKLFRRYLKSFQDIGLFKRSIVILMSDHGHRYNTLRRAASGYFEERMPMMFIYVPPWFRRKYPQFVANLKKNRNRLTSNYDVHMTLQHLLQLPSKSMADFPAKYRAKQCPSCQSLFFEVPFNRTCAMAGIEEKWCCCQPSETITSPLVEPIVYAIVERMNHHLVERKFDTLCHNYTLKQIVKVDRKSILATGLKPVDKDEYVYIVQFKTRPNLPEFEATVRWNNRTKALLGMDVDDISRLNSYNKDANCMNDKTAKKYCICKDSIRESKDSQENSK
ncbi:hypothetical protein KR067_002156 [Drosophila pandora]|nr:hypothetical protein KR067_002156 [Drosophila pandora]